MVEKQNNLCGICAQPLTEPRPSIDHDHETNNVRSITHHYCNLILGIVEEKPELIEQCKVYLEKYKEVK